MQMEKPKPWHHFFFFFSVSDKLNQWVSTVLLGDLESRSEVRNVSHLTEVQDNYFFISLWALYSI